MPKQILIYLSNGSVDGIWKVRLPGWDVLAYKVPRDLLTKYRNNPKDEFFKTFGDNITKHGIYFLLGWDDEIQKQCVYVGQAQSIKTRILAPHTFDEKWEWTEVIFFVGLDNDAIKNLSYIEQRFYSLISDRYTCKNSIQPPDGIPVGDKYVFDEFIENAKLVMAALGQTMFQPLPSIQENDKNEESERILSFLNAKGIFSDSKFFLLKGSEICKDKSDACPKSTIAAYERHRDLIDENNTLKEDIPFDSPSGAACFVAGYSVNGRENWKDKKGRSINDLEKDSDKNSNNNEEN